MGHKTDVSNMDVAAGCFAFILFLALNLGLLAAAVWVVCWVLEGFGVI